MATDHRHLALPDPRLAVGHVRSKPIILAGCVIGALTDFPLFKLMAQTANPDLYAAREKTAVVVVSDPADCSFQFNPTGTAKFAN